MIETEHVVPRTALVDLIELHSPRVKTGRSPFAIETVPRIHSMQSWFNFSDMVTEEALIDTPLYRESA